MQTDETNTTSTNHSTPPSSPPDTQSRLLQTAADLNIYEIGQMPSATFHGHTLLFLPSTVMRRITVKAL
jgi:hypothetical protein